MRAVGTDSDFLHLFETYGPLETARRLGVTPRSVYGRRARLETRTNTPVKCPAHHNATRTHATEHPARHLTTLKNGVALVGSDAHYWPDLVSPAHRAFVHFCKTLAPKIVILNGDVQDGARISRHPPIGWENHPSLIDELEVCKERTAEIEAGAPKAERIWTLGNHDARFETRLATVAPEYARIHGFHLRDHFPNWTPCWSTWINDDVVVKHRWKGGVHATHNNTMGAGKTIITGHLHSPKVAPYTDYTGTRYGVDCGTLADPDGPQFTDYTEDNPKNWRSGFVVLTFRNGRLMLPELVLVVDANHVEFRGEIIKV